MRLRPLVHKIHGAESLIAIKPIKMSAKTVRRMVALDSCFVFTIAFATVVSRNVFADDSHYQDFVVGGRAIGLAGAFAAIADDPSGLYYNPSGIADVKHTSLQLSTSLYGFEQGSISDNLTLPVPGVDKLKVSFTDVIIVPASAGFVSTFGPKGDDGEPLQSYGVSVVVPSFRSFSAGSADATDDNSQSYQRRVTDRELWSGVGYARKFGRRLRLGLSGYYVLRNVVDNESVSVRETLPSDQGDKFQTVNNDISFINGNAVLIGGAKYWLLPNLTLGFSVRAPSIAVHSSANLRFTRAESDPSASPTPRSSLEQLDISGVKSQTKHAPALRFGINYQEYYRFSLSADVHYHFPVDYTLIKIGKKYDEFRQRLPFSPRVERQGVVNFNVGGEYLIIREVSISGGIFSDFSTAPKIRKHPEHDQPPQVNLWGLALALGYFGEHTLSRLGVTYSFGRGYDVIPGGQGGDIDRIINQDQTFARVNYFQSFFYVFLSSSFRY